MAQAPTLPYLVNFWGSKPGTDDDCHTGFDFATLAEAECCYADPLTYLQENNHTSTIKQTWPYTAWVELDGPDVHKERFVQEVRRSEDDDAEWRREMAMQAGMAHGCDAYNDTMGCGLTDPDGDR